MRCCNFALNTSPRRTALGGPYNGGVDLNELTTVLIAFTAGLLLGVLGTLIALRAGKRFGLIVRPRLYGKSATPITYLGGPVLTLVAIGIYLSLGYPHPELGVLVVGALGVLVLGFIDDLLSARDGLSPTVRVVAEAAIAGSLWLAGVQVFSTGPEWVDAVLTVIFLVAAMNAFNLVDNMDGVAGMTATAAAFGLAALALAAGQWPYAVLAASVGGAAVAFLFFNAVRPRAYLGDAGSLSLGLLLGGMALTINAGFEPPGNFVAAVVIFAVPFTDTVSRQLSRWVAGGSPFDITGSTDHLSHRLVALGFNTNEVARLHGAAGLFAGAAAGVAALIVSPIPLYVALAVFAAFGLSFVVSARNGSAGVETPGYQAEGPRGP